MIATLIGTGAEVRPCFHSRSALIHDATPEEIAEAVLTTVAYAGAARGSETLDDAREVFAGSAPRSNRHRNRS